VEVELVHERERQEKRGSKKKRVGMCVRRTQGSWKYFPSLANGWIGTPDMTSRRARMSSSAKKHKWIDG
jgi:hypothetical protein